MSIIFTVKIPRKSELRSDCKTVKFAKQNSKNLAKNQKRSWTNFLKSFLVWSGAKECKSCRSRKILKNEPTLAIGGVDVEENEPPSVVSLISSAALSRS